ncbi:MAG: hypothetical protein ACK4HE_01310 [Chitinophagaceae bacterium]
MSKYDALLYDFLVEHKQISIEKIGTLQVIGNIPLADKDNVLPSLKDVIQFNFDKKATTSIEFIEFAAARFAKNKSLVASDIESYFEQVRQFINIGKQYVIPGVGMIGMLKIGQYDFTPNETPPPAAVPKPQPNFNDTKAETAYETETAQKTTNKTSKQNLLSIAAIFIGVLVIAGIGYFVYTLVTGNSNNVENTAAAEIIIPDTTATLVQPDTLLLNSNSQTQPTSDSVLYKFIHETTASRNRAISRTAKLKAYGYNADFDSITDPSTTVTKYRLFISASRLNGDTLKLKDSLQQLFTPRIITIAQ